MGSILLWGEFSGRGDFSLEVNRGSDSHFPQTLLSTNRGLVCAHMHSIAHTLKILTFMSQTSECWQQKTCPHAPSTKMECDYLNGWIKNGHICKHLTQTGEPQRCSWGMQKKRKKWLKHFLLYWLPCYRASARAGWPSVSTLSLGEWANLICYFYLSVVANATVQAVPPQRYTSILLWC